MRGFRIAALIASLISSSIVYQQSVAQSAPIQVLTRDGGQLLAERVELRGDTFLIFVQGSSVPIELRSSDIKCIGPACAGAAGSAPPTGGGQKNEGVGVLNVPK